MILFDEYWIVLTDINKHNLNVLYFYKYELELLGFECNQTTKKFI